MNTKHSRALILFLITAALLPSCNLPFGRTPEATLPPIQELNLLTTLTQVAIEHDVQETITAPTTTKAPTITLTLLPPVTVAPSIPSEVQFRRGGTTAYFQRDIMAGEGQSYTIEAGAGQDLIVVVSSEGDQVTFEIDWQEDGTVLVPFSDQASSVRVPLPQTGIYQITLTSPGSSRYFLTFEVPAVLPVSPGASALLVDGYLDVLEDFHPDSFTHVRYQLQLQAGNLLNVRLSSPALEGLSLALIGADDGQPFLRHEVQSTAIDNFVVPVSQKYYLDVYSVSGVSAAFSLEIGVGQ